MKRLLAGAILALAGVSAMRAQEISSAVAGPQPAVSSDFPRIADAGFATPVRNAGDLFGFEALPPVAATASMAGASNAEFAIPAPVPSAALLADPEPAPVPTFIYGGRDDYRFQMGLGVSGEFFRSSIFDSNAVGINTSVSYYLNNWLGLEANILSAYGSSIFDNDPVRLFNLTGGPRIAWREKRWEPWIHALVGISHEQPQVAAGGTHAFAAQIGGGVDYRINPRLSLRLQGDFLHTSFFNQEQNSFTTAFSVVIHF